ncbi:hypothetical protein VNO78_09157 [Psophocarpus tetragonolobus]|uniref:Uncharacterized protein n=1 Tax=Psophocarpus tetragonolobus TaxID=3891 RepID=A0AAN9SVS2_PSOTE
MFGPLGSSKYSSKPQRTLTLIINSPKPKVHSLHTPHSTLLTPHSSLLTHCRIAFHHTKLAITSKNPTLSFSAANHPFAAAPAAPPYNFRF